MQFNITTLSRWLHAQSNVVRAFNNLVTYDYNLLYMIYMQLILHIWN